MYCWFFRKRLLIIALSGIFRKKREVLRVKQLIFCDYGFSFWKEIETRKLRKIIVVPVCGLRFVRNQISEFGGFLCCTNLVTQYSENTSKEQLRVRIRVLVVFINIFVVKVNTGRHWITRNFPNVTFRNVVLLRNHIVENCIHIYFVWYYGSYWSETSKWYLICHNSKNISFWIMSLNVLWKFLLIHCFFNWYLSGIYDCTFVLKLL